MYIPTDLYYNHDIIVSRKDFMDNRHIEMSIEQRDFSGVPDCKIGNFGYNFWYRTRKAIQEKSYKNEQSFRMAIVLSMKKHGWTVHGWTE